MNLALNTLAARAVLLQRGRLAHLNDLAERELPEANPARVLPRIGTVRLGGARAVQLSANACGVTVLALANALFDERLRHYLSGYPQASQQARVRGRTQGRNEQAELAEQRFARVQGHLLRKVTGWTWPQALGTPPWGLARELRVPGVVYEHLPVDDRDVALTDALTMVLRRATQRGIPVPLYVGGAVAAGAGKARSVSKAAPRHVVLLVPPAATMHPPTNDFMRIYEPASGRILRRPWSALWHRRRPDTAFGGWTHVSWAVLPRAASS